MATILDPFIPATDYQCAWFFLCVNQAVAYQPHPILGQVPICDRCKAKIVDIESGYAHFDKCLSCGATEVPVDKRGDCSKCYADPGVWD